MFLRYNFFGIIWSVFIAFLILTPGKDLPDSGNLLAFDKIAHAIVFAILTLLLMIGFSKQYTYPILRNYTITSTITIITLYNLILECIQITIPERQFDGLDLVANTTGLLFGLIMFVFIYKI